MKKTKQAKSAVFVMDDPYPGAHIRVKANSFYHHGIYVGDGQVVEFGSAKQVFGDASLVRVQKVSVEEFLCGEFLEVRVYSSAEKKKKFADAQIAQTALDHVGEGGYHILNNNCEHFANFCIFGQKDSEQVDGIRESIRSILKGGE